MLLISAPSMPVPAVSISNRPVRRARRRQHLITSVQRKQQHQQLMRQLAFVGDAICVGLVGRNNVTASLRI